MTKQKHAAVVAARRKQNALAQKRQREMKKSAGRDPLPLTLSQGDFVKIAETSLEMMVQVENWKKKQAQDSAQAPSDVERFHGEGGNYPMAADAPAMSRIASLIDRLHNINSDLGKIRADNGELLQSNLGYREKGFGPSITGAGTTKAEPVSKLGSVEDMLGFISEKIIDINEQGKLFNAVLG